MKNGNILELRNLTKVYPGGVRAAANLDYSLETGSINAFLGPNGAGKTTVIGMICGLCRPTDGEIIFRGTNVNHMPSGYRRSIGVISQHLNLELDLSVYENLKIHSLLYGLERKKAEQRIRSLLAESGLSEKTNTKIRQLSGGMRRRVQIVRALLHEPELMILDEPTVGLDPASRENIWNMILGLNLEGKTILFSTHYMEEAQNHSGRVSIMHKGGIIADGSPEQLIQNIGMWCVESFSAGKKSNRFFDGQTEAENAVRSDRASFEKLQIRKTSLEDVFISITGGKFE